MSSLKYLLFVISFICVSIFFYPKFIASPLPSSKDIAFIVHTETIGGKGVLPLYKEMKKVGHTVKIIAIPSFYNQKVLADIDKEYLKNFDQEDILYPCGKSPPYTQCTPLTGYHFDALFVSTPYNSFQDSPLDPHYLTSNLKSIAKKIMMVVYGPHLFHQDTINDPNLPTIIDTMFVDSQSTKDIYIKRYKFPSERVEVSGYPTYKDIRDQKEEKRPETKKMTLLWLPRWTLSFQGRATFEGGSTFLNYHYFFYRYLKENPDIKLIIRPHILLYTYSVENYFISQEDLDFIFKRFKSLPNVEISDHAQVSLNKDILSSDIVISDGTSALGEVVVADKPIIYLSNGWNNEFNSNELSKEFKKHILIANKPQEIMDFIQYIKDHNYTVYSDEQKCKTFIQYIRDHNYTIYLTSPECKRNDFKKLLDPVENPAEHIAKYLLTLPKEEVNLKN